MGRTEEASKNVGFIADVVSWWRTVLMPTEAEKNADKYFELPEKYLWHQKELEKATAQCEAAKMEKQRYWVEKYRIQLQEIKDADLKAAMARRDEQKKAAEASAATSEQAERD